MTAECPRVSIGLPVYNGERYLVSALDGILRQSFRDFEVVISDNASSDRTREICAEYCKKDSRVRYSRNDTNIGAARNFNKTVQLSRGSYFAWAAYDDVYNDGYLERCVDMLDNDPSISLCHSRIALIDEFGNPTDRDPSMRHLDKDHVAESQRVEERFKDVLNEVHWCLQGFGLMRTDQMRRTGLQRSYFGADKVFLAEISLIGRFHQIGETLFYKRVHGTTSFYKTTATKKKWIDPAGARSLPQVQMLKDYTSLVMNTPMRLRQRLICLFWIVAMVRRPKVWHRTFVPGPDNYFGIDFNYKRP